MCYSRARFNVTVFIPTTCSVFRDLHSPEDENILLDIFFFSLSIWYNIPEIPEIADIPIRRAKTHALYRAIVYQCVSSIRRFIRIIISCDSRLKYRVQIIKYNLNLKKQKKAKEVFFTHYLFSRVISPTYITS